MMEWGRKIKVDGKRPAWLADDETPVKWYKDRSISVSTVRALNWGPFCGSRTNLGVHTIRLPVDHFAYAALDAGFEPWGGGDAEPEDWDGREVLFDYGALGKPHLYWKWRREEGNLNVIGYRKRDSVIPDSPAVWDFKPAGPSNNPLVYDYNPGPRDRLVAYVAWRRSLDKDKPGQPSATPSPYADGMNGLLEDIAALLGV